MTTWLIGCRPSAFGLDCGPRTRGMQLAGRCARTAQAGRNRGPSSSFWGRSRLPRPLPRSACPRASRGHPPRIGRCASALLQGASPSRGRLPPPHGPLAWLAVFQTCTCSWRTREPRLRYDDLLVSPCSGRVASLALFVPALRPWMLKVCSAVKCFCNINLRYSSWGLFYFQATPHKPSWSWTTEM